MRLLVGDVFRRAAAAAPALPAAHFPGADGTGRTTTFGELDAAGNRVARAMRHLDVRHHDRVVWWGNTGPDALPVFVACAKLGAVFAPVNALLGIEEAHDVVALARASAIVADPAHALAAEQVAERVGIPLVLRVGAGGAQLKGTDLDRLAAEQPDDDVDEPALSEDDMHVVFFTSGSTGRPKGVVLSHRANVIRTFPGNQPAGAAPTVCMFPLFHMAGWTIALGTWQNRAATVFVTPPTAANLLDAVQRHHARRLYAIPAVWKRVLAEDLTRWDLSSLVEADTGTSATPPELLAAIKAALPHTVTRVFYGSTEAGPCLALDDVDLTRKPGSVGVPQPGVEVRLSDGSSGGVAGEIEVRSVFLFDGYYRDHESTASALVDGWYRTGDLGSIDEEGYVSVVGRARDVLRTGGETIAPAEVEIVLTSHEAVEEAAVVGLPDPTWGETVCAVIVLRPGHHAPTVDELRSWCTGRLAPFKHPRRVEVVDRLPRTPATGQIQRALLVERLALGGTGTVERLAPG